MRSVGRSAPLHPLGDGMREGSHPLALSRGCSVGGFGLRRNRRAAGFCLRHFCFRGGLHENFVPDRTSARRVAFIGAFAFAAVLAGISFSTARDVGRSDPLHPLGDGMREGSHPLALSRGCSVGGFGFRRDRRAARLGQRRTYFRGWSDETLVPDETGGRRVWNSGACSSAPVRSKVSTSDEAVGLFWRELWFPTARAWGALLPYTPSGTGCERVHTLSRSPGSVRSEGSVSGETGGRRIPSAAVRALLRISRKCPWRSFGNGSG